MANVGPIVWYVDSVAWSAMSAWSTPLTPAAGTLKRQAAAPTVGNERAFVCIISGAVGGAEPVWVVTKGAKTVDNAATWMECTGQPGVNGDTTNSPTWTQNKNNAVTLGLIIFDSVTSSLQIVTTAGTTGNGAQPGFSATAGVTTADNTVTWTSLGLASNFGTWAAAAARLQNVAQTPGNGWGQASDTFYLASEHAETQATAETITFPGQTPPTANLVISVNKNTVPPTSASVLAGASISTTGSSNLVFGGSSYRMVGVNLNVGSGVGQTAILQVSGNGGLNVLENCAINLAGTGSSSLVEVGSNNTARVVWNNVTFQVANAASHILFFWQLEFEWKNTASAIQGATIPSPFLFEEAHANNQPSIVLVHGVDFGALTSALWGLTATLLQAQATFIDCKIGAGCTIITGSAANYSGWVNAINVDSGATGYRNEWHTYYGDVTTETTITRSGGASDYGPQNVSHKVVSSANVTPNAPLISPPIIAESLLSSGTHTATVEIISSGTLNNNDVWLELEFEGSNASPLSSFVNNGLANPLSSPAAQTSSTATWNSSPPTPVKQKLQVSFTPRAPGNLIARVMVGKASATLYYDPAITVA